MHKVLPLLNKLKNRKILSIVVGVVLVGIVGGSIYFFRPHPAAKPKTVTVSPEQQIQKQRDDLIATVEKQIALPKDEEPVFATVSDRDKLQEQEFFKNAQNGDKILMYKKNKKAFLYRPSTQQVLATAPLVFEEETEEASDSAETTAVAGAQTEPAPSTRPRGKILVQPQ